MFKSAWILGSSPSVMNKFENECSITLASTVSFVSQLAGLHELRVQLNHATSWNFVTDGYRTLSPLVSFTGCLTMALFLVSLLKAPVHRLGLRSGQIHLFHVEEFRFCTRLDKEEHDFVLDLFGGRWKCQYNYDLMMWVNGDQHRLWPKQNGTACSFTKARQPNQECALSNRAAVELY